MATQLELTEADRRVLAEPYSPFYSFFLPKPVIIKQSNQYNRTVYTERPALGVLLFDNVVSDARDHCANERTFLSWLRLAVYMAIVSVAIVVSFHLRNQPSAVELKLALPFGLIFWLLSLACLGAGLANYLRTVQRYSQRMALVQSGWKTELIFTVVAAAIVAACVLFLTTNASTGSR